MGKEQCLFLGVLKEIFGRRSEEKFRQLHLWLSNAWYSTEGTIWTVGESFAFSLLTSCSVHSGMIRDTSLAIKVGHIFLGTHVSPSPESGRLLSPPAESPPRNGSSQVAAWGSWSVHGMMLC